MGDGDGCCDTSAASGEQGAAQAARGTDDATNCRAPISRPGGSEGGADAGRDAGDAGRDAGRGSCTPVGDGDTCCDCTAATDEAGVAQTAIGVGDETSNCRASPSDRGGSDDAGDELSIAEAIAPSAVDAAVCQEAHRTPSKPVNAAVVHPLSAPRPSSTTAKSTNGDSRNTEPKQGACPDSSSPSVTTSAAGGHFGLPRDPLSWLLAKKRDSSKEASVEAARKGHSDASTRQPLAAWGSSILENFDVHAAFGHRSAASSPAPSGLLSQKAPAPAPVAQTEDAIVGDRAETATQRIERALAPASNVDFPMITDICERVAAQPSEAAAAVSVLVSAFGSQRSPPRRKLKALTIMHELAYDELAAAELKTLPKARGTLRELQQTRNTGLGEATDEHIRMFATELERSVFGIGEINGAPSGSRAAHVAAAALGELMNGRERAAEMIRSLDSSVQAVAGDFSSMLPPEMNVHPDLRAASTELQKTRDMALDFFWGVGTTMKAGLATAAADAKLAAQVAQESAAIGLAAAEELLLPLPPEVPAAGASRPPGARGPPESPLPPAEPPGGQVPSAGGRAQQASAVAARPPPPPPPPPPPLPDLLAAANVVRQPPPPPPPPPAAADASPGPPGPPQEEAAAAGAFPAVHGAPMAADLPMAVARATTALPAALSGAPLASPPDPELLQVEPDSPAVSEPPEGSPRPNIDFSLRLIEPIDETECRHPAGSEPMALVDKAPQPSTPLHPALAVSPLPAPLAATMVDLVG